MKVFLQNDVSKKQLFALMLRVWSSKEASSQLEYCNTVVIVVKVVAHHLSAADGKVTVSEIHDLHSKQVSEYSFYIRN